MKNVMMLIIIGCMFLAGCTPEDYNDGWDLDADWELYTEGEITSKEFEQHPTKSSKQVTKFTFGKGKEIICGHIKNNEKVKKGQKGFLYVWTRFTRKPKDNWFQWVEDKTATSTDKEIELLKMKVKLANDLLTANESPFMKNAKEESIRLRKMEVEQKVEMKVAKAPKIYEWKEPISVLPKINKTVLIKTTEDVFTTEHM